jgi:hypothetical protein
MAEPQAQAVPNGEPAAAKVRGGKWPAGVERLPNIQPIETKIEGIKYYARLRWLPPGATAKRYDTIPGLYSTPTAAAEALGAAQALLMSRGAEAVWPKGVPGSKATQLRTKRDAAYWVAEAAAREQKAAEKAAAKAAAKAAREAAEAARPKKPRREKEQRRTTVPLPANRDEITKFRSGCLPRFRVRSFGSILS